MAVTLVQPIDVLSFNPLPEARYNTDGASPAATGKTNMFVSGYINPGLNKRRN
jgi:hypothetical protein